MNLFNEEEPQENDIVRQISKHCKRLGNEADFNEKKQQLIIFNPLNDRRVVLNLKKDNFVQIISYDKLKNNGVLELCEALKSINAFNSCNQELNGLLQDMEKKAKDGVLTHIHKKTKVYNYEYLINILDFTL